MTDGPGFPCLAVMSDTRHSAERERCSVSQSDDFRQYAEEAMLSASKTEDKQEVRALMELAVVWALAAFESRRETAQGPASP